jgi:hypothetical protein
MVATVTRQQVRRKAAVAKLHVARRLRAANGAAFIERNHDRGCAALVLGSGRSGTTWYAESLARYVRSRLIFEPLNPYWTPIGGEPRLLLEADDVDRKMGAFMARVLEGRTRRSPLCQTVITRLPQSRVVKDIHSNNLVPWYRATFPEVPVIFAVRHPIPACRSRLRYGGFDQIGRYLATEAGRHKAEESALAEWLPIYDAHREHPDPLVGAVTEWCIENVHPLSLAVAGEALLTFYETAVREPTVELERMAEFCAPALGQGREDFDRESMRAPSTTDFFGTISAADGTGGWDAMLATWMTEVPAATTRACVEVLADFGLDRFYDADPLPLTRAI